MEKKKLILASGSPRRKLLLEQIDLSFEVIVSKADETIPASLSTKKAVMLLAERKAKAVAESRKDPSIIIAADTVVVYNNKILGKPSSREDAFVMLKTLQDDKHEVYTGLCLIDTDTGSTCIEVNCTEVYMRNVLEEEIWEYIDTGEPMDKAGAYGIQGRGCLFVEKIIGDYYNVVGLPLLTLYRAFYKLGIDYKDYAK